MSSQQVISVMVGHVGWKTDAGCDVSSVSVPGLHQQIEVRHHLDHRDYPVDRIGLRSVIGRS